jgi:hypothetical protein
LTTGLRDLTPWLPLENDRRLNHVQYNIKAALGLLAGHGGKSYEALNLLENDRDVIESSSCATDIG